MFFDNYKPEGRKEKMKRILFFLMLTILFYASLVEAGGLIIAESNRLDPAVCRSINSYYTPSVNKVLAKWHPEVIQLIDGIFYLYASGDNKTVHGLSTKVAEHTFIGLNVKSGNNRIKNSIIDHEIGHIIFTYINQVLMKKFNKFQQEEYSKECPLANYKRNCRVGISWDEVEIFPDLTVRDWYYFLDLLSSESLLVNLYVRFVYVEEDKIERKINRVNYLVDQTFSLIDVLKKKRLAGEVNNNVIMKNFSLSIEHFVNRYKKIAPTWRELHKKKIIFLKVNSLYRNGKVDKQKVIDTLKGLHAQIKKIDKFFNKIYKDLPLDQLSKIVIEAKQRDPHGDIAKFNDIFSSPFNFAMEESDIVSNEIFARATASLLNLRKSKEDTELFPLSEEVISFFSKIQIHGVPIFEKWVRSYRIGKFPKKLYNHPRINSLICVKNAYKYFIEKIE